MPGSLRYESARRNALSSIEELPFPFKVNRWGDTAASPRNRRESKEPRFGCGSCTRPHFGKGTARRHALLSAVALSALNCFLGRELP